MAHPRLCSAGVSFFTADAVRVQKTLLRVTKRPTARILPWGILSILIVLIFSYCLGRDSGAPVSAASVEFAITPGKPEAPTERVKLTKQGNAYRLSSQRNSHPA